ncbi:hypothetical protein KCU65_g3674, partial [Aureobasidium melanogenum]
MDPQPYTKNSATKALTTLRSTFHTSTLALRHLETYIHHLEDLLLEELGREEFERRLECLILRDQRNEESLFIPDDNLYTRKRRGSESVEVGSEMKMKKQRADSAVEGLGRKCSQDVSLGGVSANNNNDDNRQANGTTSHHCSTFTTSSRISICNVAEQTAFVKLPQRNAVCSVAESSFFRPSQWIEFFSSKKIIYLYSKTVFSSIVKKGFCCVRESITAITLWLCIFCTQHSSPFWIRFLQICKTDHDAWTSEETSLSICTSFKFSDQEVIVPIEQDIILLFRQVLTFFKTGALPYKQVDIWFE